MENMKGHPMADGIPGLVGTDHIGLTVPNLDQAIDFFCEILGCELVYTAPAAGDDTGTFMQDQLNVHPRSRINGVAFLRGGSTNYELFEYTSPDHTHNIPKNSDVGGHHIAFYVDDMETAVAYLKAHGLQLLGKPVEELEGPDLGVTWQYFLSPWGLQLELISYPHGKGYEHDTTLRLYDPRRT